MDDLLIIGIKAVNGGLFVVAFAVVSEMAMPKRFAGLFAAAPSIALANLLVIALAKNVGEAQKESTGMIVGAVAMFVATAVGVVLVRRFRSLRGSLALCGVWACLAEAGYLLVLR